MLDLDALEASVMEGPYEFSDWSNCLCGHVYRVTVGSQCSREDDVRVSSADLVRNAEYKEAILEFASLLGYKEENDPSLLLRSPSLRATSFVSGRALGYELPLPLVAEAREAQQASVADVHEYPLTD